MTPSEGPLKGRAFAAYDLAGQMVVADAKLQDRFRVGAAAAMRATVLPAREVQLQIAPVLHHARIRGAAHTMAFERRLAHYSAEDTWIFADNSGTLRMDKDCAERARHYIDNGGRFAIVSADGWDVLRPIAQRVGREVYVVSGAGDQIHAVAADGTFKKLHQGGPIPGATHAALTGLARELFAKYFSAPVLPDEVAARLWVGDRIDITKHVPGAPATIWLEVRANKIAVCFDRDRSQLPAIRGFLQEFAAGARKLTSGTGLHVVSTHFYVDVITHTKDQGIAQLLRHVPLGDRLPLCVGDSDNDLPMLNKFPTGMSFFVGNHAGFRAIQQRKDVARWHLHGWYEAGLARMLARLATLPRNQPRP